MFFGILLIGTPIVMIASALIYLPFYVTTRNKKNSFIRHATNYIFIGCCLMIAFATIFLGDFTIHPDHYFLNLKPFIWIKETYTMGAIEMTKQLILNIFMFVPLGILFPIVFKSLRTFIRSMICALLVTATIETCQYFTGRSADIDDVIMNLLGGIIGYCLYVLMNYLFDNKVLWEKIKGTKLIVLE